MAEDWLSDLQEGQAGMASGAGYWGGEGEEHCVNSWSSAFWVNEESAESPWVGTSSKSARVMCVGV